MAANGLHGDEEVWQLFIPEALLAEKTAGYLLCTLSNIHKTVYIIGLMKEQWKACRHDTVSHPTKCQDYDKAIKHHCEIKLYLNSEGEYGKITVCGSWRPKVVKQFAHQTSSLIENSRLKFWLSLYISDTCVPQCDVISCDRNNRQSSLCFTCIVMNVPHLLSSYFLTERGVKKAHNIDQSAKADRNSGFVDSVVQGLLFGSSCLQDAQQSEDLVCFVNASRTCFSQCNMYPYLTGLFVFCYSVIGSLFHSRLAQHKLVRTVLHTPAVLHQLNIRYLQLKSLRLNTDNQPLQSLRKCNVFSRILLDVTLGVLVMSVFVYTGMAEDLAVIIITWADEIVVSLSNLLEWLMGVPAGLKLNAQLDQFLGKFFLYHIYLWTGYLSLLKPVLAGVLWGCSLVGVLGLSTQLCLFQDILSTLTLHIYCFYVYAARLYYFQLYGLSSLWRLFRGKKWNILRQRVDSAAYDVDQLFAGTLLFTILLFLFPTTALYYIVFLLLRVVILIINGIMSKVVSLLNTLPVHALILRCLHSKQVAGSVYFQPIAGSISKQSAFFSMKVKQVSLQEMNRLLIEPVSIATNKMQYTWVDVLKRVCKGELIYPWIEAAAIDNK